MKCDQDLCLNLCYDLKKLLWQDELNPRVRCAFGNVYIGASLICNLLFWKYTIKKAQQCSSSGTLPRPRYDGQKGPQEFGIYAI